MEVAKYKRITELSDEEDNFVRVHAVDKEFWL